MFEQVRHAIDGVPGSFWALIGPTAVWAYAWVSPFTKTYRHARSGALSVLSGLLFAFSPGRPIVFAAGMICLGAMAATMLWPSKSNEERKVC